MGDGNYYLWIFVESYHKRTGGQSFWARDLVDYVIANVISSYSLHISSTPYPNTL